jgi:hypothetical protein
MWRALLLKARTIAPIHFLLGIWLSLFYRQHMRERDERGEPNVGLVVLIINLHAYLLNAVAFRATKLGGRNNYRCHGPAADGTGAAARHRAAPRNAGNRDRRPVSDTDRHHPSIASCRAGDDADEHYAAIGMAGVGRRLRAVLCELSRATLLDAGCRRIVDRSAWRPMRKDRRETFAHPATL